MKASDFWTEEEKKKAKIRGLARFNKIMPIYVEKINNYSDRKQYLCYYMERGIIKYANISNPYTIRYGPGVIATLTGKTAVGLWQAWKGAVDDATLNRMTEFAIHGKLDLPVLNLDEFTFES